ncbi:MAG: hypothetical protein H6838_04050 [Planctomycetes bacterium]|nr:hypothetical protein [Planctomycetota bacterium]MCB9884639.1 hypothetical protein [Planctomycetota bacterium]
MAVEEETWRAARDFAHACLRRFGDAWTVRERDDLVQESLLLAWQWAARPREPHRVTAAVRTIATRLRIRGLHRRPRRSLDLTPAGASVELLVAAPPGARRTFVVAGRRVAAEWLLPRLQRELSRLRPFDRELLLARNEGARAAELARRFDCTVAVVRTRTHRARRRVQRAIENDVRAADPLDLS